ncbi:tyrosine-type recombinase/integrase [Clostridium baratii]|uniref:tyrosine-type recombinase/integrase n=1 Tax=Clostridium baratii TaxID=1561 RepID=UPI0030CD69E2
MKVQEIKIDNLTRYIVIDDLGLPIIPIAKYIKFLDNRGISPNSQKTYCFALKAYFEYLNELNINYKDIDINVLSNFISWLRNPNSSVKVTSITPVKSNRSERTINLMITVVTGFYDYLFRIDEFKTNMMDKLMKKMYVGNHRKFKDFLFHVNKDKPINKNILKLKTPRKKKVNTLSKDEVEKLYSAANNLRDKLLIRLLFETGFRISEALSLHIEDFIYDHKNGHRIRLVDRGELENKASLKTGAREVYISQELMDLFDDYEYEILDELEVDSDFVFIVLAGKNAGKPLGYRSARAIFENLKKKTGIKIHAHLLRHTHATLYYNKTKDVKQVQERLGHSQISTTMDLYVHPSDKEIRENWNKSQDEFRLGE